MKLVPALALPLGMIFHELATNAAKYGAFAHAGTIRVRWEQRSTRLQIEWEEECGTVLPEGSPTGGFGSTLLDRSIRLEMGGDYQQEWHATGMRILLSIPQ